MLGPSRPIGGPRPAEPDPRRLAAAALVALGSGLLYYGLLRGSEPALGTDPSVGTFPSLVHGFATTLLLLVAAGPRPARRAALAVGANVALTAVFEVTLGTFDPNDLLALGAGTLAAVAFARVGAGGRTGAGRPAVPGTGAVARAARSRWSVPALLAASATMTMATAPDDDGSSSISSFSSREPVYLGYAELRGAVRTVESRPLEDVGRVYVYEDFLFLNARNEGVHVIDNSDPTDPRPVSFIEIPGNTELEIRDGVLFADSYVDLVAIELGGFGTGPQEVEREEGIFPWDPYQNVPPGTFFSREPDPALGVVVGIRGEAS